ncbi:MFS transporter [Streptomyces sp. WMMB 322]|uniref:MFS transporter n=1 Tax=Streptomyces sp. WMMB 322 TaxID=1286821 RepID=UPI0006E395C9|nr:MFS transporter [Streptomyces sp. WMMB 322]SCK08965.1 hypothetical protein H180DRAFT_00421 [Streptomyces sp. WMMB 322]
MSVAGKNAAPVKRMKPVKKGSARSAKSVLLSVIGLHLVAETALTPFLPQLFERLYGIDEPGATGLFIWVGRIAGLAALPLWGLAARRWPLHRLVLAGLVSTGVLDLLLGMAPSYTVFVVLSTLIVSTNSALLLAYPAFIAEHGDDSESGVRARLTGICSLVIVFHLSVVVSTLVGAGVLALPEPRIGISSFAVLDAVLAVFTYRILGRRHVPADGSSTADGVRKASGTSAPNAVTVTNAAAVTNAATAPNAVPSVPAPVPAPEGAGDTSARRAGRRSWIVVLGYAALIGVAFDFSVNVARPFFTEFAQDLGSGSMESAVLFFLPSVSALAVLPAVHRGYELLGDRVLPLSLAVGTAGLLWTWMAGSLPGLVGGRLLFGVGLGLGQVAVELRMFRAAGTKGPAFTVVETARSAGLLGAPVAATAAVSHDLALPLAVAAAGLAVAAVLSMRRSQSVPSATSGAEVPETRSKTATAAGDMRKPAEPEQGEPVEPAEPAASVLVASAPSAPQSAHSKENRR